MPALHDLPGRASGPLPIESCEGLQCADLAPCTSRSWLGGRRASQSDTLIRNDNGEFLRGGLLPCGNQRVEVSEKCIHQLA